MTTVKNRYEIGETVYMKGDMEFEPYIITCIRIYPNGGFAYEIQSPDREKVVYEFQIQHERQYHLS